MAESFFSALNNERVHRTVYATKAQARRDVIGYIEGFYNTRRRHSALGYKRALPDLECVNPCLELSGVDE